MKNNHIEIILAALAEKLKSQGDTINYQELRIDILEKRLKESEKYIKSNGDMPA